MTTVTPGRALRATLRGAMVDSMSVEEEPEDPNPAECGVEGEDNEPKSHAKKGAASAEQQQRLAEISQGPAFRVLAEQQRRLAEISQGPALRVLAEQQRRLAEISQGPALRVLAEQHEQLRDLVQSPALVHLVASHRLLRVALERTGAPEFAASVAEVIESGNVGRWTAAAATAGAGGPEEDVTAASHELADDLADTVLRGDAAVTAYDVAGELAQVAEDVLERLGEPPQGESVSEDRDLQRDDEAVQEFQRVVLQLGAAHLIAVCAMAAILSGNAAVALTILAAIAQVSGYSLKDMMGRFGKGDSK